MISNAAIVLAFVLGGLMEENLRRSLLISDGSWSFLWDRPLTICILIAILLIIAWQLYGSFKKKFKFVLILLLFQFKVGVTSKNQCCIIATKPKNP